MVLYCDSISSRVSYISEFLAKEMQLGDVSITTSVSEFLSAKGPKINYSRQTKNDGIWIKPYGEGKGFMWESGIRKVEISFFKNNGHPEFFATAGDLSFDILAASFYLLSRYEEYLPHSKDIYGRYAHENSIAFKEGFINLPLVNIWAKKLLGIINERWKQESKNDRFSFLPTYDIDIAWSYKHKGWWRNFGGLTRSLLKGKLSEALNRINVLTGKTDDPFDAFEWMNNLHSKHNLKPYYFFLVANKSGRYDKNISPSDKTMQKLIRQHAKQYPIGIHPSWQSGDNPQLLPDEIKLLSAITDHRVLCSRQHFIRFTLPDTFRRLLDNGILFDFSMGYGTINGFRASVASPYYWYDLEKEKQTELMLFPFCYMEANSFYEQKHSPAQAFEEMQQLYLSVKDVQGTFIMIWHNSFLGTDPLYRGWRETYARFVEEAEGSC
jgi:hypothetical protein